MVTVPTPFIIQRNSKQVGSLQPLEHLLTIRTVRNRVAQRTAQAVEDGGLLQESSYVFGLAPENLFGQVVQNVTAAALQRRDEFGDVFAPPHRERCELQPSDPAFGTLLERHQRVLREIQAHRSEERRVGK